jgi:RND family efflux transporter MFP subunit
MKRFAGILIGLAIIAGGIAFSALLWVTRPLAEKEKVEERLPLVEVQPVRYEDVSFDVPSQGIIESARRTRLASAVAGRVTEVNPAFEPGKRVSTGTWLVKIEPVDYLSARAAAAASLADSEAALAAEIARSEQARRDWLQLGKGGEPTELASRQPQLHSAVTRAEAARSALEKADFDVKRTTVTVPFDGIIASTATEVGSYLAPGAVVAEIFETRYEVRLPLSVDQLPFLRIDNTGEPAGEVDIVSTAAGETTRYRGRIVRTEGEIDRASRSLYLVAEVEQSRTDNAANRLRPGLFVKARIAGRTIPNRARIPFNAFVDLGQVAIVAPDNTLQFRDVTVVFRDDDNVYISGGVAENDLLCLTELPAMITGQRVSPKLAEPARSGDNKPGDPNGPTAPRPIP